MAKRKTALGVDLGTTTAVLAYASPAGRPATIPNFEGEASTPAVLTLAGSSALVGTEALKAAALEGAPLVTRLKRGLGTGVTHQVAGQTWHPTALAALVLKRLRKDAEVRFGHAQAAVFAVPATFDAGAREALVEAATLAGWKVLALVNDPVAAAIADSDQMTRSGLLSPNHERLLVCDLGGETCEATVLDCRPGHEYRMLASVVDLGLGGQAWDAWLVSRLAEQFRSATGKDPLRSTTGRADFAQLASRGKRILSEQTHTTLACISEGMQATLELRREEFEAATQPLARNVQRTAEAALRQASLKWRDLDRLLLVGGASRMPMIAHMLQSVAGKPVHRPVAPEETVAHGAALYAWQLQSGQAARIQNISPLCYRRVHTSGSAVPTALEVIPNQSSLPFRKTLLFPPKPSGNDHRTVELLIGDSAIPEECRPVARVRVTRLPEKRSGWKVGITLCCSEEGRISATAAIYTDPPDQVLDQAKALVLFEHEMTTEEQQAAMRRLQSIELN